jgi:hypothetical protein
MLLGSPFAAFYAAFALMLEGSSGGKVVLPLLKTSKQSNLPGSAASHAVGWDQGEAGVKQGQ